MTHPRNYVEQAMSILAEETGPLEKDLLRLYALLALTRGTDTTLEDVHDAWALWRNETNPQHRSLRPFDALTIDVQELDRRYADAIHRAAGRLPGGQSKPADGGTER